MDDCHFSVFLNITSFHGSARQLVGKWQLASNQLSRNMKGAKELGIISVRDIEANPCLCEPPKYIQCFKLVDA